MVEVTQQGHQRVDQIRGQFQLSPLEKYWHNRYLDEAHWASVARQSALALKHIHHFETYQFLSKVVHPLVVSPEEPAFLAGFNHAARIVGGSFPDYPSVAEQGLAPFLQETFRSVLKQKDPDKVARYDQVAQQILEANLAFPRCSHQVLFAFERVGS